MLVVIIILFFFIPLLMTIFGPDYNYFSLYPDHFSSSDMDWVSLG